MTNSLHKLTVAKLRSGELMDVLPELFKLKETVENSRNFHKNDNVFDHTLRVTEILEGQLDQGNYPELETKITNYTRHDLLFFASLLHDIGKNETLVIIDGFTTCPGHEAMGVKKSTEILKRFDLSEAEQAWILHFIQFHQAIFDLLNSTDSELDQKVGQALQEQKEYLPELVLFTIADIQGSQLKETRPEEFAFRIDYLEKLLKHQ